jgi:D-serine deaminase-like pyridoxal phosphate-dependent protein
MNIAQDSRHHIVLPPPALPGQPLEAVDTPSLVLDLDVFERNLDLMQERARQAGVQLRPHAKAHKCPDIARAQIARGAVGVCCQKVSEAVPFVMAGINDVHISNEMAGPAKAELFAKLARHARMSVCVDDAAQIADLGQAAAKVGARAGVFVEVDVGQGRCGVPGAEAALRLAELIAAHDELEFRGLQAYHGGAQHIRSRAERKEAAKQAADKAAHVAAALAAGGFRCETVTGGGSGSAEFDLDSGVYTEIQPGTYAFMDEDYGRNEYNGLHFEHALFIVTAVMSAVSPIKVVVDAGLKSMAVDSGLPEIWQDGAKSTSLIYVAANDEHGIVKPVDGAQSLPLGSRLRLLPGHCDPTFNLYDQIIGVRGGVVECVWPIAARGLSR